MKLLKSSGVPSFFGFLSCLGFGMECYEMHA